MGKFKTLIYDVVFLILPLPLEKPHRQLSAVRGKIAVISIVQAKHDRRFSVAGSRASSKVLTRNVLNATIERSGYWLALSFFAISLFC